MIVQYQYLKDKEFLRKLDDKIVQERYVRISLLDFVTEEKIKDIEGKITDGSLNKDGSSAARITGSLSCTVNGFSYDALSIKSDFSINKKIFIEIGIANDIDSKYPDIIWFPQGVMLITSFSFSTSGGGAINLSIEFKDKIALLDGTVSGTLQTTTRFDQMTDIVNGEYVQKKTPVYQIIQESLNHYCGEQIGKILVDDVPKKARRALKWTGNVPLWILWKEVEQADGTTKTQYEVRRQDELSTLGGGRYNGQCFKAGYDVGYVFEDFVYDKELTMNAGTTISQLLDTIKNWLGNYEYFYDEYGFFHFQEIKNYLNTNKSSYEWNDSFSDLDYQYDPVGGDTVYTLDKNIGSVSFQPKYENIKNDYIVIGKTDTGNLIYHFAIDDKPTINKDGYENILVYKDSVTENYTLSAPQILKVLDNGSIDFPVYGEIDKVYGVLDVDKEITSTRLAQSGLDFETEIEKLEKNNWVNLNDYPTYNAGEQEWEKYLESFLQLDNMRIVMNQFTENEYYSVESSLINKILAFLLDMDCGGIEDLSSIISDKFKEKILQKIDGFNTQTSATTRKKYETIYYLCMNKNEASYAKSYDYLINSSYFVLPDLSTTLMYFYANEESPSEFAYKRFMSNIKEKITMVKNYLSQINSYFLSDDGLYLRTSNQYLNRKAIKQYYENLKKILEAMLYRAYKILISKINSSSEAPTAAACYIEDTYYITQPEFYTWSGTDKKFKEVEWCYYYKSDGGYDYIDFTSDNLAALMAQTTETKRANMKCNSSWYKNDYISYNNSLSTTLMLPTVQEDELDYYICKDWRTEIIIQGLLTDFLGTEKSKYYSELIANWPNIYNLKTQQYKTAMKTSNDFYSNDQAVLNSLSTSQVSFKNVNGEQVSLSSNTNDSTFSIGTTVNEDDTLVINTAYMNNKITGNYFLDILDPRETSWGEYSVTNIGRRTLVVTDDDVNCLFPNDPPDFGFIFVSNSVDSSELERIKEEEQLFYNAGYTSPLRVRSDIYNYFSTGGGNKSAYDTLKYNLLTHTNYQETANITVRPIYYLQPNTLVKIDEEVTSIFGNYEIKSISLPMAIGQMMTINVAKANKKV